MTFISYRCRLLAGTARGKKGSKGGGGRVRLSDVDTGELAGFKDKLICRFILSADMVGGGIQEIVNDTDRSAFLERKLMGMGTGRSAFTTVQVDRCPFTCFESI